MKVKEVDLGKRDVVGEETLGGENREETVVGMQHMREE